MYRSRVELRQIRYFVAVAEELHFGRAAARLGIAQPPLSQQIGRLERELGFGLFSRTSRRVSLTEPGRVFLDRARWLLTQADEAVASARAVDEGKSGYVRVGLVGSAGLGVVPAVLKAFRNAYPDVELTLLEMSTTSQIRALADGHIDIGFVRRSTVSDVRLSLVVREPIVAAVPVEHELAACREISPAALDGERFVVYAGQRPGQPTALNLYGQAGFRPRVVQEAESILAVLGLISAGIGIATVPASTAAQLQIEGVVFRPIVPPDMKIDLYVAWRDPITNPAADKFRLLAIEVARTLSPTELPG
jgi:DNA-binding transcriptional LysR family regulator